MNEISGRASGGPAQPSPYTDRRALSEAWYRALFDSHRLGSSSASDTPTANAPSGIAAAATCQKASVRCAPEAVAQVPARTVRLRTLRAAFTTNGHVRSGPARAGLALRAAVRRAVWRRTLCRTTLPAGRSVDLLVQQRGDLLRLVAMYDGRDAGPVTAALLRARTALLQRGLRVELDARQKGTS